MYLIGRYISISGIVYKKNIKPGLYYWICTFLIFGLVYASFKLLHIVDAGRMQAMPWGLSYSAPLVILQAVFLFIWFARLNFQSKIINWCAASCLSIFLIHMHPSIKSVGYYNYTESLYSLPTIEHVWKLAVLMSIVFFGSILIDKVRILFFKLIYIIVIRVFQIDGKSRKYIMEYIPNTNLTANNKLK